MTTILAITSTSILQFLCFFRKYHPCLVIAKGILLPVDKMFFGRYFK